MPESMEPQNSCMALFSSRFEVLSALQKLADAGLGRDIVAAMGREIQSTGNGPCWKNGMPAREPWGQPYLLQTNMERTFPHAMFFYIPGIGILEVSGFFIHLFSEILQEEGITRDYKILPLVFSLTGISESGRDNYSLAIRQGQFLVMVRGAGEEVETAAELLATGSELEVAVYQETPLRGG